MRIDGLEQLNKWAQEFKSFNVNDQKTTNQIAKVIQKSTQDRMKAGQGVDGEPLQPLKSSYTKQRAEQGKSTNIWGNAIGTVKATPNQQGVEVSIESDGSAYAEAKRPVLGVSGDDVKQIEQIESQALINAISG